jgi:hypothetical protein
MQRKRLVSIGAVIAVAAALAASAPAAAASPATADTTATAAPNAATAASASDQANGNGSGPVTLTVKDTKELGPINQNPAVVARDNGQSVLYHGKSYWFFDDTMLRNPDAFLSSTAAVTSDLNASDGISLQSSDPFDEQATGAPTEFVPYSSAETAFQDAHASSDCTGSTDPNCGTVFAFWPGAAVADPAHHRILVFYGKLCRGGLDTGPCASGFVGQALGNGIVSVDMRTHQVTRLTIENQDPTLTSPEGTDNTLLFPPSQNWGNGSAVLVGNELYAYGNCGSTNDCAVAKVPVSQVQDHAAWRFYTGDSHGQPVWSNDPTAAIAVAKGGAAGGTVYHDPTTGLYMNTFMPFLDQQVSYQTAPNPWGPWTTPANLFAAPKTSGVEYAAFAHPEYTTNNGLTRYYSYYTSSTGQQMLVKVDFTLSH